MPPAMQNVPHSQRLADTAPTPSERDADPKRMPTSANGYPLPFSAFSSPCSGDVRLGRAAADRPRASPAVFIPPGFPRFEEGGRRRAMNNSGELKSSSGVGMAVEAIDDLRQERDGLGVAPSDAVRGEAQSRRQAGHLHPLVIRPVVAATRRRRGADDLPQPLSRKPSSAAMAA